MIVVARWNAGRRIFGIRVAPHLIKMSLFLQETQIQFTNLEVNTTTIRVRLILLPTSVFSTFLRTGNIWKIQFDSQNCLRREWTTVQSDSMNNWHSSLVVKTQTMSPCQGPSCLMLRAELFPRPSGVNFNIIFLELFYTDKSRTSSFLLLKLRFNFSGVQGNWRISSSKNVGKIDHSLTRTRLNPVCNIVGKKIVVAGGYEISTTTGRYGFVVTT
jgi:hypothetical protein